jgi:hypothetical protein
MLIGVRGRPIRAAAVSSDSDTLASGETRTEKGAAQRMAAQNAVSPAATGFQHRDLLRKFVIQKTTKNSRACETWFDVDQLTKAV